MLDTLTRQLDDGTELTDEQVRDAISCLTDETVTPEAKARFLTALATKGETTAEIAAFASELRAGGMGKYIWVDNGASCPFRRAAKLKSSIRPFMRIMVHRSPSVCSYV